VLLMFLLWIVPYSLAGAKWLRYTLSLMPWIYMLAAIGVMATVRLLLRQLREIKGAPVLVVVLAVLIFVGLPAWAAAASGPHYALYTNALGSGRAGYYFPHDEFYDDGLREAIKVVCDTAPQGAIIAHETPAVTRYYLSRCNRTDLESHAISEPNFDPAQLQRPAYFILQTGRIYFENSAKLQHVRQKFRRIHDEKIGGLTAAEVYVSQ
jgi:hypothetical protein